MKSEVALLSVSAAALALAAPLSASATDLGVLSSTPTLQSLDIPAPDVTFEAKYVFSLADASSVSATASNLPLSLGGSDVLGISDFSLKLFDASNHMLATVAGGSNTLGINDFALPAAHYYFEVSGETTGGSGGHYALAAVARGPAPVVAEPNSVALLLAAITCIGLVRTKDRRDR